MSDDFEDVLGDATSGGPFVTIHVRDVNKLVREQGGAAGELISRLAPRTIERQVYDQIAQKLRTAFKGTPDTPAIDAEVAVVDNAPRGRSPRDIVTGAALGASAVGLGYGVFRLVKHIFFKRSR